MVPLCCLEVNVRQGIAEKQRDAQIIYLTLMSFGFPADKLAFVGFKGTFHPDWVHLVVDTDRAKIHQVLPVPVVHKIKL